MLWLTEFVSPLPAAWVEHHLQSFSESEARRLARMQRQLRREQFIVGHVLLRRMLASLGVPAPIIETGSDGAPWVAGQRPENPLHVSLAHSKRTVAALASTAPAGVDLEVKRTLSDPSAILALFKSGGGRVSSALPAGAEPSEIALRSWVGAEARTKAGPAKAGADCRHETWHASWNGCLIAVAGTDVSPVTVAFDLVRDTYNPAALEWTAGP